MKIISTKVHGYLDYSLAIILILSPILFGLDTKGSESIILYLIGGMALTYSLFTDYELGLIKMFSMKTHLALDRFSGLLLAVSPWLLDFWEDIYLPHLILGILELIAVQMTATKTSYKQ